MPFVSKIITSWQMQNPDDVEYEECGGMGKYISSPSKVVTSDEAGDIVPFVTNLT